MTVIENLNIKDLQDHFLNVRPRMLLKRKFIELDKHNESSEINNRKAMSEILCMQPCFNKDAKQASKEDVIRLVKSGTARSLAIVGQTEIGKTHLLKQLLKRKDITNSYEYIFYVSLKYHVCSKKTNVLKFLVSSESQKYWMDCKTSKELDIFKIFKIRLRKELAYACGNHKINHQNLKKRQRDLKYIGYTKMHPNYLWFAFYKILNIPGSWRVNVGTK